MMRECGSWLQMKGHKGDLPSQKKKSTGAHLNAGTRQGAPEESSERAGGAGSITKLTHAD